ncbi:hypothetical protein A3K86_19365 [Photobacterium jeanii]|uniref:Transcription elongation factor n=1 Tax=Photobacterium jeanii TaxID=858640 RepID=A0A178K1C8_9GAMM|nr:hypothetical protein [Photobacterium jeanii]OAN11128.1 hypothetical protein A3K86_19365 [Photobacterium jeanii]PST90645.1 transcription elongation factor [Photobacterium jeanii]
MNKQALIEQIIEQLTLTHQTAVDAAQRAHETATNEENAPENEYDTLSLEAAYLAHGQSQRVAECIADLQAFKALDFANPMTQQQVILGSLVELADEDDKAKWVFFGPSAGGLKLQMPSEENANAIIEVTVVTPSSPLGKELLNRAVDDEVELTICDKKTFFDIIALY